MVECVLQLVEAVALCYMYILLPVVVPSTMQNVTHTYLDVGVVVVVVM